MLCIERVDIVCPSRRVFQKRAIFSRVLEPMLTEIDRKSTRLNYSHQCENRMPSSALKKKLYLISKHPDFRPKSSCQQHTCYDLRIEHTTDHYYDDEYIGR